MRENEQRWAAAVEQVDQYQKALPVRTFLSCGKRWVIYDERGGEPVHISEEKHAAVLIEKLRPFLEKGSIVNSLTDPSIWKYGTCPSGTYWHGGKNDARRNV